MLYVTVEIQNWGAEVEIYKTFPNFKKKNKQKKTF